MNKTLKKIGLFDQTYVNINLEGKEFLELLRKNISNDYLGLFEVLEYSPYEYKGIVRKNGFRIKPRRAKGDISPQMAWVKGKVIESGEYKKIRINIYGVHWLLVSFFVFSIFITTEIMIERIWSIIPFILVPYLLFVVVFVIARKCVGELSSKIVKDLMKITTPR